jgi:hypothetical protein
MKKIFIVLAVACSLMACNNEGENTNKPSKTPDNNDSSLNKADHTITNPRSDSPVNNPANNPAQSVSPDSGLMRRPHQ